ncbi:MAG: flagellar basal body rod protein FlgC [Solirubrobacteraceae bacterium]|nr:flagellar basal body rod protein FlgC [Solirubrobacteraceae bacterium]
MGLFDAMNVSASGLSAERVRMDTVADNLANAQTTGGPNGPYRRKEVVLAAQDTSFAAVLNHQVGQRANDTSSPKGVRVVEVTEDPTPNRRIYDPGHPDANADGYVEMPNVNSVTEMVDLIAASRGYEANVTAMSAAKQMFTKTIDLLR